MTNKILFIDEKESFISRAIIDSLKQAEFEVSFCLAKMKEVSKINPVPDLIFINLQENFTVDNADLAVYIKDLCIEGDRLVFLTGYQDDIKAFSDMLPKNILGGTFERPVKTKEIGEQLSDMLESSGGNISKKHILVVDDSGESLRAIKGWLSPKYQVSMVNSAANAISFLATNQPDLILLDYEMPVCSGPQLLEMIRAESKSSSIPVIFLTSKDDKESVAKVLKFHPQGYLLKTLPPESIIKSIDEFFQLKKAGN